MKFSINLPFSEIIFVNAKKRHKSYFGELFFAQKKISTKPVYKVTIVFKKIDLTSKKTMYLEEDIAAVDGSLFISDTKENRVKLTPSTLRGNNLKLVVDPDFDLYFLYNFIVEPLLIIWAAKNNILYVHASALAKNGKAHAFIAWRHTGKTSSIFSMAGEKIKFMGDDFCVISNSKLYLYPKNINIFSYNFESYPWLYSRLSPVLALRIKLSVYLKKILYWFSEKLKGALSKVFFRLSELAEISTNTKVTPKQLGLVSQAVAPFAKAVIITKSNRALKKDRKLSPSNFKQKLLSITSFEIKEFMAIYEKYIYIYPEKGNTIIGSFKKNYLKAIETNLKEAYESHIVLKPNKDAHINRSSLQD